MPTIRWVCDLPLGPAKTVVMGCCRDIVHGACLMKSIEKAVSPGQANAMGQCPCCGDSAEIIDLFLHMKTINKKLQVVQQ